MLARTRSPSEITLKRILLLNSMFSGHIVFMLAVMTNTKTHTVL